MPGSPGDMDHCVLHVFRLPLLPGPPAVLLPGHADVIYRHVGRQGRLLHPALEACRIHGWLARPGGIAALDGPVEPFFGDVGGLWGSCFSGALRLPGGRSQGRSRVSGALPGHIPPGSFLSGGLPVPQSRKASWCGRFPVVPKLQFCFFELVKYREKMPLCHYPENVQEFVLSIP